MSAQLMLFVQAKVAGQKKHTITDWYVPLPPDVNGARRMTLRDLITHVVANEIQAFRERQEERRLARLLTARDIQQGAERGKIDLGERDLQQEVDEPAAIAAALQAFEDGLYFVFLNDEQQQDLNREVFLGPDSRLLFVRLVALSGG
jgi:hypothetical protein